MTEQRVKAVIDTTTGETTYEPLSPSELSHLEAEQASEVEREREEGERKLALDSKVAELRVLADTLKSGHGTDEDRARALLLLLDTHPLLTSHAGQ